jgi:hypothetical protein
MGSSVSLDFLVAISLAAARVKDVIMTLSDPNLSTARGTSRVASLDVLPVPGGPNILNSSIFYLLLSESET